MTGGTVPVAAGRRSRRRRPCSGGRVATLIYDRTPYGQVRLDEFDGHLDPVYFEKFVHLGNVTEVRLNGAPRVVLRLEGGFGKAAALAVAASAR